MSCSFERSTSPEHDGTKTVVIRILEILEPIQSISLDSKSVGEDLRLKVGELLPTRHARPWSYTLGASAQKAGSFKEKFVEALFASEK